MSEPGKTCRRCGSAKPAAFFYKNKLTSDKLSTYCKACAIADAASRRAALTPEEKHEVDRKRAADVKRRRELDPAYDAVMRERGLRIGLAFRSRRPGVAPPKARDPEAHAEYMREWRLGNLDRARQISRAGGRKYREADPERHRIQRAIVNANKRAKKGGIPGRLSYSDWLGALEAHGRRCAFCLTGDAMLDMEHVQPLRYGGHNTPDNIAPACRPCNAQKHSRTLTEFCRIRGLDEASIRARVAAAVPCAAPP